MSDDAAQASDRSTRAEPGRRDGIWRWLAALLMFLASAVVWGYAWWLVTMRREIFVSIGDDVAAVTRSEATRSDALDERVFWASVGLTTLAVVVWVVAKLAGRLLLGAVGFTCLALLGVGAGVAAGGAYLTSLVESTATTDRAVLGCLVAGGGWALVGLGLFTGMVSLFVARQRPPAGQPPRVGYAAWARR